MMKSYESQDEDTDTTIREFSTLSPGQKGWSQLENSPDSRWSALDRDITDLETEALIAALEVPLTAGCSGRVRNWYKRKVPSSSGLGRSSTH